MKAQKRLRNLLREVQQPKDFEKRMGWKKYKNSYLYRKKEGYVA